MPISQYDQLRTGTSDTLTLDDVRHYRTVLMQLAQANNIESDSLQVFGSVSRGKARSDSDLDLIVTPAPGATLLDLSRFEIALESLFGREVDVISSRSLDVQRDAEILRDAIPV